MSFISSTSSSTASSSRPFVAKKDSAIPLVVHLNRFFAKFPLHSYPSQSVQHPTREPCLWIAPPTPDIILPSTNLLSADVECLKWQAYIALRGVKGTRLRWNIPSEAAVDARLPSLLTSHGVLLGARMIPTWVDETLHKDGDDKLEGYISESAKEESRAWVTLLEGIIHAALLLSKSQSWSIASLLPAATPDQDRPLSLHLSPPPAPLSGISSLFQPFGIRASLDSIKLRYSEAIVSLSLRLGDDNWFLGSSAPTALDALAFAYLYTLLNGPDSVRQDINKRTNLLHWERRVRVLVQTAFEADSS